jgi:hypothetical protein
MPQADSGYKLVSIEGVLSSRCLINLPGTGKLWKNASGTRHGMFFSQGTRQTVAALRDGMPPNRFGFQRANAGISEARH